MGRSPVVGMLRVQEILLGGGRRSWTIVWPDGAVHEMADRYLRWYEGDPGTQRTSAFLLVDHLRWLEREALPVDAVSLRDLERYMGSSARRCGCRSGAVAGEPAPVRQEPGGLPARVLPVPRPGQISVFGMAPLMKAELKWGLFAYTQRTDHTRWWTHSFQRVLAACQQLRPAGGVRHRRAGEHQRMIVAEMRRDLQSVYVTPSGTREAGYINFEHFGRRIAHLNPVLDLNACHSGGDDLISCARCGRRGGASTMSKARRPGLDRA